MKKIVFLSIFPPFQGGISDFNSCLCNSLLKEHEVKIISFNATSIDSLNPTQNNNHCLSPTLEPDWNLNLLNPLSWHQTFKKILSFKPDIVITSHFSHFVAISVGTIFKWCKEKGIQTITIFHHLKPLHNRKGYKFLTKYMVKQSVKALVMNKSIFYELEKFGASIKTNIHPHPLYDHFGEKLNKESARALLGIPQDKKVLLFFGLIRPYKGLDILLEAFGHLNKDYFLLIAGECFENKSSYEHLIATNRNQSNIMFIDKFIPHEEVNVFFSASDVSVLPYKNATQSGILAMSFHFDLPIITTDCGGLKESIEAIQGGQVVFQATPIKIANSILNFFSNNLQFPLKENIKKNKKKYNWDSLASSVIELSEA